MSEIRAVGDSSETPDLGELSERNAPGESSLRIAYPGWEKYVTTLLISAARADVTDRVIWKALCCTIAAVAVEVTERCLATDRTIVAVDVDVALSDWLKIVPPETNVATSVAAMDAVTESALPMPRVKLAVSVAVALRVRR